MMGFLKTLMAPIGQPEKVTGINPIFGRPEPVIPPGPPIRRGPPIRPPKRPRPRPNRGGIFGELFERLEKKVGGRPPFIQELRPPTTPPLEDFGFGPGIRRSEDFFRPEDKIMGKVNLRPPQKPL